MAEKTWSEEFLEYEKNIVENPNYEGLPITKGSDGHYNWVAPGISEIGKQRKEWADKKGEELGISKEEKNYYAKVMLKIHPTKTKPCQICGRTMSLLYLYPNANMAKSLKKIFNYDVDIYETIYEICNNLIKQGIPESTLVKFLLNKCKIEYNYSNLADAIQVCELKCRLGASKALGPGAMSNFPDRYDGFHTYNRCCRQKEDTGRSKENLKSYGRDRRAYEYFSDGNIQAANKFMVAEYFDGASADHICPISLGFVHDPRFLQRMGTGDNSSKRDRLYKSDVLKAMEIENKFKLSAASWQAQLLWNYLKEHINEYDENKLEVFKNIMKQNMNNFLNILYDIKSKSGARGIDFITKTLINPKYKYFEVNYEFNDDGTFTKVSRNKTERASGEFDRIKRISLDSLDDYHDKENRNLKPDLTETEITKENLIIDSVIKGRYSEAFSNLQALMEAIQIRELKVL